MTSDEQSLRVLTITHPVHGLKHLCSCGQQAIDTGDILPSAAGGHCLRLGERLTMV